MEYGEGARIGLLGDSGCGKSYAARAIRLAYLDRCAGLVAVADSKGEGSWPGEIYASVADLAGRPPAGREIVFQADLFSGEPLSLEAVASWQWAVAARRRPVLVIYDEISDGCIARGERGAAFLPGSTQLPRVFTHGRRVQISAVWGAQYAQQVPREAWEESDSILCWRQAGNALAILRRRHYLEGEGVEEAILSLPGPELPPARRGAFVWLRRARAWDGRIYRL